MKVLSIIFFFGIYSQCFSNESNQADFVEIGLQEIERIGATYNCWFSLEMTDVRVNYLDLKVRFPKTLLGPKSDGIDLVIELNKGRTERLVESQEKGSSKVKSNGNGAYYMAIRSQYDSNVIHLIDYRLYMAKDYPLTKFIDTANFVGPLDSMCLYIGKSVPGFRYRRQYPIDVRHQPNDGLTIVNVFCGKSLVRDLFTRALPIKQYGRILWISESSHPEKGDTEIHFPGPESYRTRIRNRTSKGTN